jgi:hypothetical protein
MKSIVDCYYNKKKQRQMAFYFQINFNFILPKVGYDMNKFRTDNTDANLNLQFELKFEIYNYRYFFKVNSS